jgi:hypothetical protein
VVVSTEMEFLSVLLAELRATEGVDGKFIESEGGKEVRGLFGWGLRVSVKIEWFGGGEFKGIGIIGWDSPLCLRIGDGCTDCKPDFHKPFNSAKTSEIQILVNAFEAYLSIFIFNRC